MGVTQRQGRETGRGVAGMGLSGSALGVADGLQSRPELTLRRAGGGLAGCESSGAGRRGSGRRSRL